MKNVILALLSVILLVAVANLALLFLIFRGGAQGGAGSHEYKALNAVQMDDIGFLLVAEEEGIEVGEDGEISFPQELAEKIAKASLMPRTILEVEGDGGWEFVAVTADNHYLFKRPKK
jgi:hypothetical protein